MTNFRKQIFLILLTAIFLLCSIRYYPDQLVRTLRETFFHLLPITLIDVGMTLIVVTFVQKLAGERLPRAMIVRVFLTIGISMEFFLGLYDYLGKG